MSDETLPDGASPDDERPADTAYEGLLEEGRSTDVPDDERVVPEDVNEYLADDEAPT